MHPTTTHHTHPSTVSSEPAVHTRQEPSEPRVSLLLGLLRQFTISSLDIVFLQGSGSCNIVQFMIETTGIADWLTIRVSPPQCGGVGATIGATRALTFG